MNAETWLFTEIGKIAGITGGVHRDVAPSGTASPFVVINNVRSRQIGNAYKDGIMDREIWRVKIYTEGKSYSALYPLADDIRYALHKKSAEGIVSSTFEDDFEQHELDAGKHFKTIVMEFELHTQQEVK